MHLSAEGHSRNDKEEHEESHSGSLNKLGLDPASSAAHQFGCGFRPPKKDLRSDDEHSRASGLRPSEFENNSCKWSSAPWHGV
jgi:hypothetical protein